MTGNNKGRSLWRALDPIGSVPSEYRRRCYRHLQSWMFYGVFFGVVMQLAPFVIRALSGTAVQCLLPLVGRAVPMTLAILWTPLAERHRPAGFISAALCAAGLLMLLSGLSTQLPVLVLLLAAAVAVAAVHEPVYGAAMQQIYPLQWRGKLLSLPTTGNMLVRIVVIYAAGHLLRADISYHRYVFSAAGATLILSGLIFRTIPGSHRIDSSRERRNLRQIWTAMLGSVADAVRNRPLLLFLMCYSVAALGTMVQFCVLPLFAHDSLLLDTEQWALAAAAGQLATLLCLFLWGLLMDRIGAPAAAVISYGSVGLVSVLFYFTGSFGPFLALFVLRRALAGGLVISFYPVVMSFSEPRKIQRAMGFHFSLAGLRWLAAPLAVSLAVDAALVSPRVFMLVGAALMVLGSLGMAAVCVKLLRPGEPAPRAGVAEC